MTYPNSRLASAFAAILLAVVSINAIVDVPVAHAGIVAHEIA